MDVYGGVRNLVANTTMHNIYIPTHNSVIQEKSCPILITDKHQFSSTGLLFYTAPLFCWCQDLRLVEPNPAVKATFRSVEKALVHWKTVEYSGNLHVK